METTDPTTTARRAYDEQRARLAPVIQAKPVHLMATALMTDLAVQPGIWVHRPTRVRAMQLTAGSYHDVFAWLNSAGAHWWAASDDMAETALWLDSAAPGQDSRVRVRTPQGARRVLVGDWIVHGVGDIWYPVSDAVWRESYEAAEDG